MDVVVAIDAPNLVDSSAFIKHLQKEGLEILINEEMVFVGQTSTTYMQTKAYLTEIIAKAYNLSGGEYCNFVCQIGENPPNSFRFQDGFFEEIL